MNAIRNFDVCRVLCAVSVVLVVAMTCLGGAVPAEAVDRCPQSGGVYTCDLIDGNDTNASGWSHGDWWAQWSVSVTESKVETRAKGTGTWCLAVQDGATRGGSKWKEVRVSTNVECAADIKGSVLNHKDYVRFSRSYGM